MAALICIKIVCGTFCQLVNIANRFLRIFSNLETLIRFIFSGGCRVPLIFQPNYLGLSCQDIDYPQTNYHWSNIELSGFSYYFHTSMISSETSEERFLFSPVTSIDCPALYSGADHCRMNIVRPITRPPFLADRLRFFLLRII